MNGKTFQKQYPIALMAIADHIIKNHLEAPLDIQADLFDQDITLLLPGHGSHEAWLASVEIEGEANEYRPAPDGVLEPYFRTTWTVRLPDSAFVLRLRGSRPLPLTAVSA